VVFPEKTLESAESSAGSADKFKIYFYRVHDPELILRRTIHQKMYGPSVFYEVLPA